MAEPSSLAREAEEFLLTVRDPESEDGSDSFFPSPDTSHCCACLQGESTQISIEIFERNLELENLPEEKGARERAAKEALLKVIRIQRSIEQALKQPYSEEELAMYLFEGKHDE